jgi:hypothetical protein
MSAPAPSPDAPLAVPPGMSAPAAPAMPSVPGVILGAEAPQAEPPAAPPMVTAGWPMAMPPEVPAIIPPPPPAMPPSGPPLAVPVAPPMAPEAPPPPAPWLAPQPSVAPRVQPVAASARASTQPAPIVADDFPDAAAGGAWGDCVVAGALSAAFHLVAFILLALHMSVVWPAFKQELVLSVASDLEEGALGEHDFIAPADPMSLNPANVYSSFVGEAAIPLPVGAERLVIDERPKPREDLQARLVPLDREARRADKGVAGGGERRSEPRMAQAASTQQALDGVLGEIGARAAKQDLLVVWLFDASVSLREDRPQIATRLANFFQQQDAVPEKEKHLVMSAAVAFGSTAVELEPPTRYGKKIIEALGRVPNDTTGMERTFAAVKWAVLRYAKRKGQLMIVVWTDEAGDDLQELEAAVQTCQKHKVLVSAVGPTAVLGRIYGRQSWPNPAGGRPLGLQVNRGPDSPSPERLLLPYWFETRFPSWGEWSEGSIDEYPAWYGGPQLEYLLCGLGPYGLVRLVTATGGTYTLLDRAADRNPFRLEVMRDYAPSCQSVKEYQEDLRHHPFRQAVANAVDATLGERNWPAPRMIFAASQAPALVDAFLPAQAQARRSLQVINRALSFFGRDGMEKLYEQEKSPRWRAWYDLTRGRLLACLVRYGQYELLCTAFQRRGVLRSTTNRVVLTPAAAFRGDATVQATAGEAERLLRRCMQKNPNTPWAYLAQRELDYPPGVDFQQEVVPQRPPQTPKPGAGKAAPKSSPSTFVPPRL